MFRLTSSNLPQSRMSESPSRSGLGQAPAFTVWGGENRGTGPILRVNCYGNWWENPGWELDTVPLGIPVTQGKYYQIALSTGVTIAAIANWGKVDNAIAASSDTFWESETTINLYQRSLSVAEVQSLEIPAIATSSINTTAPLATSGNYIVEVPTGFTATSISSLGLVFTNGTGIGNFSQTENTVTIYGSAAYSLLFGQDLVLTGNLELVSPRLISSVASFHLKDVAFVDRISWAGHNFSPTKVATSPKVWEFTWNGATHIANLFLESTSMPYFKVNEDRVIDRISGIISFER